MPTTTASEKPNITRYMVKAACSMMLPSAMHREQGACAMTGIVGSSAGAK